MSLQVPGPGQGLPPWRQRQLGRWGPHWRTVAVSLSLGSLSFFKCSSAAPRAVSSQNTSDALETASLLERFPFKAAATAGSLSLTGDAIAQFIERSKRRPAAQGVPREEEEETSLGLLLGQHDFVRAARMASYGFLVYGPMSQLWYQTLETLLPGTSTRNLTLKVGASQVFWGPCAVLAVLTWNFVWMGRWADLQAKLKKDYVPSLVDGWKFWIPVTIVNFRMVPLRFRVAYMCTCAIFWNCYLSSMVGKDMPKTASSVGKDVAKESSSVAAA